LFIFVFFFSSRRRHTRSLRDWSSDVCSSDLITACRLIQGMGGGMLLSLSYVAIEAWFAPELWGRLFAIDATIWGAGSLLGPLIRSEERRVGKECGSVWWGYGLKKKRCWTINV